MKKFVLLSYILSINFLVLNTNLYAQADWGPDVRLTFIQEGRAYHPQAACCGDTVHLVWYQGYSDTLIQYHREVFYKRSTDAGSTWEDSIILSIEDFETSVLPAIAINQNYLHLAWQQVDVGICYRKSTNGGNSWLPIDTLPNGGSGHPSICAAGNNVYVVAYRSDGRIIFSKSTDNGDTWLPSQVIGFDSATAPCIENLGLNGSNLIVSCENFTIHTEIYYKKSTDSGSTWSDSVCISQYDSVASQRPAMDTDDIGGVYITWYDYKYSPYAWTGDIFYRTSEDSGNTWEQIDSLTVMHRARASDILAEESNLHLVWEDDRHGFGYNFEIYYRMSTDLGNTWLNEIRLTDTTNHSKWPSLACNGQYLHLFWCDFRDDPSNIESEIYYKRKTLVGINEELIANSHGLGINLDCPTVLTKTSQIHYTLGNYKQGEIVIIDVTGRIKDKFPVHQSSGNFVLNINKEVEKGIYFLMLKAGDEYITRKILVVR